MKSPIIRISIFLLALSVLIASCGTSKNSGGRKCDGRKGQKTPMGLI